MAVVDCRWKGSIAARRAGGHGSWRRRGSHVVGSHASRSAGAARALSGQRSHRMSMSSDAAHSSLSARWPDAAEGQSAAGGIDARDGGEASYREGCARGTAAGKCVRSWQQNGKSFARVTPARAWIGCRSVGFFGVRRWISDGDNDNIQ
jgi:hypothetical protein